MLIECLPFLTCFMTTFRSDVKWLAKNLLLLGYLWHRFFIVVLITLIIRGVCLITAFSDKGDIDDESYPIAKIATYNEKNNTQWDQRRWNFMIYSLIQHSTFVTTIKLGKLLYLMLNHHANIIWDIIWSDKSKCNK